MTPHTVPVESSIFVEEGKSLNLAAEAVGTDARNLTYEWNFGDESASIQGSMVIHRYYLAGRYPLTLIVRDDKGAISIIEKTVVVETMPLVVTALTSHILDETKGIVAFEATSDPANSRAINYVWNFGDGGSPAAGQKVIHKFAQSGTYYVSVIASSPSGATAAQVHQIALDKVVQDSPIKDNKEVLKDYPITFNSPFADKEILKTHAIRWDFGDGTTVDNQLAPEHVYRQTGSYTVSLEITDESGSTTTSNIPVEVVPAVSKILSLSANVASRAGEPTDFVAIIDNPNDETLTYRWDFGDGSKKSYSKPDQGKQVRHVYAHEGTYVAKLEVNGKVGSHAVESISVTIDSMPQIESIAYQSNIVKDKAIAFSATATSTPKEELIYQWQVQRQTPRVAQSTHENTASKSNTSSNLTQSNLAQNTTSNATARNTISGIGEDSDQQKTGQTVSFAFLEEGLWSVTLTVLEGAKTATETFNIFVAKAEFKAKVQAKETVLVGRSAEFAGHVESPTDNAAADLRTIEWDFGDGTKIESQTLQTSHIYNDEGSYTAALSIADQHGTATTDFVAVNVVKPPLILIAAGRAIVKSLDSTNSASTSLASAASDNTQVLQKSSINSVCFYSGETIKVEGHALVAKPAIEDISASALALDPETISEVKADDSVQYQQTDRMSVEVPQHHDLVSDVLLQTSAMGYNPTCIDLRSYRKQLKRKSPETVASWQAMLSPGERSTHPRVIEIERGPLVIPAGITLENIVIVVNRGDISLVERCSINHVTLIAQGGGIDLSDIDAANIRIFSSKAIQTNGRSHFKGNSLLASQQSIVFNGATVGADALLKIISQQKVHFNASQPTQAQVLANADVELGPGTTLQGSVRTKGNVIFNSEASLNAAPHSPLSQSFKTVTLTNSDLNADLETAIKLNIRLPRNTIRGADTNQLSVRVIELPSSRQGTLRLADGSPLFAGKQVNANELENVSFEPASKTAEATTRFVYTIEDSWNPPARQTLSIRFNASIPSTSSAGLAAQPSVLWPPEYQMVEVIINGFEKFKSGAITTLDSIVCSEPIGAKGEGSDYDYEVVEKDRVFLRAVQPKDEAGRLYKLVYRTINSLGEVTYSVLDVPTMLSANIYRVEHTA